MTKITSVSDFLIILEDIEKNRNQDNELFFRGHEDESYKMQPSLFRNKRLLSNEYNLFKEIVLENPKEFSSDMTTLEKLVRMQHFGLPTRILDITRNPLVALYFACSNQNGRIKKDADGEVVVISVPNDEIKYYDSDSVSIISNLCKLKAEEKDFDTSIPKKKFNEEENVNRLVYAIREEKSYFINAIEPKDLNEVYCVKVKKNNNRILIQDGLVLIFGIGHAERNIQINPQWILLKTDNKRIIIDKDNKRNIIKELEAISITRKSLFPDIENSARMIKSKYS